VQEYTEKEQLQEAIWNNIHQKRFYPAEEVHLCSGPLQGYFGYNTVTRISQMILNKFFGYPQDFDKATKEIFQECVKTRLLVTKDSVGISTKKKTGEITVDLQRKRSHCWYQGGTSDTTRWASAQHTFPTFRHTKQPW
jgi:hypothetical protein